MNRIYNKALNDCFLGKSVSFVSLESQCFPRPELGTHIFVHLINRDKTRVVEWVLTSHFKNSLMQCVFFDISCSPPSIWIYSAGILSSKVGKPATNCKRMFLYGFWPRNMSSKTYQKFPKIRAGDVYNKGVFLEPYTEQHGNEASCTACCVARV